jgi:exodeoxyribonuclease VII large subunit
LKLNTASDKLDSAILTLYKEKSHSFGILCAKLNTISPLNTLSRGYAIVQNGENRAITSVNDINVNDRISVTLSDGKFSALIDDVDI